MPVLLLPVFFIWVVNITEFERVMNSGKCVVDNNGHVMSIWRRVLLSIVAETDAALATDVQIWQGLKQCRAEA